MKTSQIPNSGLRSQKRSERINKCDFSEVFSSGGFEYRLRWDWADIPGQLVGQQICGTCCDKDDYVYASSRVKGCPIAKFSPQGGFLGFLGEELKCGRPHGLFVDNDENIWLADDGVHVIFKIDKNGVQIDEWGTYAKASDTGINTTSAVESRLRFWTIKRLGGPFNRPTRLVRNDTGDYFVSDGYGNAAIHHFNEKGELLKTWGGMGPEEGHFGIPHSLCIDAIGRILVADREFDRVQVFDADGNLLKVISNLMYPYDVASDSRYIYISEREGRVTITDYDFNILAQIGYFGSPLNGHSMAVDSKGNIYLGLLDGYYRLIKLERIRGPENE